MKISPPKANTNTFAVFSMLLLGVFAAALVVIFDYWSGSDRSLSTVVLRRLRESDIPLLWVSAVGGLTLMSSGFFFYNLSFLAIAAPAFVIKQVLQRHIPSIFDRISRAVMSEHKELDGGDVENARFRDTFMYMLLTSSDSHSASAARFNFTQLMFGRSLGVVLVLFSAYIAWTLRLPPGLFLITVLLTWVAAIALYIVGVSFFDNVMAAGIVIARSQAVPVGDDAAAREVDTRRPLRKRSRAATTSEASRDA